MVTIPNPAEGLVGYVEPGQRLKTSGIESVDMSAAAAEEFTTPVAVPAGSVPTALAVHVPNTIDASTATKIGVGTSSDPDKYGLFDLTAGDYEQPLNFWASPVTADEDIVISACDGAGDAAGTIGGGDDDYIMFRMGWYQVLPIFE